MSSISDDEDEPTFAFRSFSFGNAGFSAFERRAARFVTVIFFPSSSSKNGEPPSDHACVCPTYVPVSVASPCSKTSHASS